MYDTTAEAVASFEAQGRLEPGQEGWWKVWGAAVRHVQVGDLILTQVDGEPKWDLIVDTFEASAAPLRRGLASDTGRFTLGALAPVIVLRWGTKNTLA